jgi:hypothetical protein
LHLNRSTIAILAGGFLLVVLVAVLSSASLAVGDSSGSRAAQAQGERPAASAANADRGDAPQSTALKESMIGKPRYFKGSDGKVHIEYDLLSTSVFPVPVTLTKVQVRAGNGRKLLTLAGEALEARTQPLGSSGPPTREVAASGSVATMIDIEVPPGEVPKRLTHRIAYKLPPDAPEILKALIGGLTIDGPKADVPHRPATVVAPPLSGKGWWNGNGCCEVTPHRSFRLASNGLRIVKPETFAIDWLKLGQDAAGNTTTFAGDPDDNRSYFAFGAKVRSATDGVVVDVRDGLPNEKPNIDPPENVRLPLDVGGNHVAVRVRPGVYAFYGHMQPHSIAVEEGERVEVGQRLGRLGSSGNSTQPHLHFDLSDGPDPLTSNSIPHVFDRYTWAGEVDVEGATDTDFPVRGKPRPEQKTYPLYPSVVDFRR